MAHSVSLLQRVARALLVVASLPLLAGCGAPGGSGGGGGGGGGGGTVFGPIAFSAPAPDTAVDSAFMLKAEGPGISRVFFFVNGALLAEIRQEPFASAVEPMLLPKGKSTYSIVAQAANGNEVKSTFNLLVVRPRPPLDELKAAIAALAPGSWYEIPETQMRDVNWPVPFANGRGDLLSLFSASGGAFDTKRGRLLVWGSGGDAYREDLYAFDVNTLAWSRLTDPPAWPAGGDDNAFDMVSHLDGTPVGRHSYDLVEYIPDPVDRLYLGGGIVDGSSSLLGDFQTYTFDFDTNNWTPGVLISCIGLGAHAAVGPDGRVWQHGAGQLPGARFCSVDVVAQTAADHVSRTAFYDQEATSEIDPVRNLFVAVGNGLTRTWSLTAPAVAAIDLVTTGERAMESARNPGLAYHAASGHLIAWSGGKDVFRLDLGTSNWTRVSGTGTVDPGAPAGRGTYGRFRYVPSLDMFIVVSGPDSNVFLYRLP